MTIRAWLVCPDCHRRFAVTKRQCHEGLRAQVVRCPACRLVRRRVFGRVRTRRWRDRFRDGKFAPFAHSAASAVSSEHGGRS